MLPHMAVELVLRASLTLTGALTTHLSTRTYRKALQIFGHGQLVSEGERGATRLPLGTWVRQPAHKHTQVTDCVISQFSKQ